MTTDTKCAEFAKQIKDLREYGPFAKELARDEVANAFEALLEIVVGRESPTASRLAPEWATLATHLETAAGRPIGARTPTNIGHVAKEAAYRADNLDRRVTELNGTVSALRAEVTDLRRQKTELETALGATMTAWHKDKASLEAKVADLQTQRDAAQCAESKAYFQLDDAHAKLDAATKRVDLAEATLESVRAAVAKPVEDKQDGRPKVGDAVPWSEVEVGCLYRVAENSSYPFRVVTEHTTGLASLHVHDTTLEACLDGSYDGTTIEDLIHFHESAGGLLIARDLGTDPEAWRAAMREHSAKVGK